MKKRLLTAVIMLFVSFILLTSCSKMLDNDAANSTKYTAGDYIKNTQDKEPSVPEDTMPDDTSEENTSKQLEPDDESLSELRKKITENGCLLGVAYLGYNNGVFSDIKDYIGELGVYETYPFCKDIDKESLFETSANELYLIVPASKDDTVEIYKAVINSSKYELEKGELLGKSEYGKPFLLLCNVSEISPNVILSINGTEYIPGLSGMDGKLTESDTAYDFSPYDAISEHFDLENNTINRENYVFCGFWMGDAEDGDGFVNRLALTLNPDGSAEYVYGIGNGEPIEQYYGNWSYDDEWEMILLDLYGEAPGNSEETGNTIAIPGNLRCDFKWNMEYRDGSAYLILDHVEGDAILFGRSGATFEFIDMTVYENGTHSYLAGSWAVISDNKEVFLELFSDKTAHYYITENGSVQKELNGVWDIQDLTLYVNFYEFDDNGIVSDIFGGEYGILHDGESLTLSPFEDSYMLTEFMEENGYEQFTLHGVG